MRLHSAFSSLSIVTALVLLMSATAPRTSAKSFWMTDAALRANFSGATIVGTYSDGRRFRESYRPDGSLDYVEFDRKLNWTGKWSVISGTFCTIYDATPTGGCFRVRRISDNCYEFYFRTRTEEEARRSTPAAPLWTARASRTDALSTCEERPVA